MNMIMNVKHKTSTNEIVNLQRLPDEKGSLITWQVLSEDKYTSIGVIREMYDTYLVKNIGYRKFKVKFWLGSKFNKPSMVVAFTREQVICNLLSA